MIAAIDSEAKVLLKLLDKRVMTRSALDTLLIESTLMGMPPIEMLLANDILSDADAGQAYAELHGQRFLDLSRRRPATPWVLSLPENVSRRKQCIVFGEVSGQLVVAVADPVDASVRAALAEHYERPLQFVVSPRFQIAELQDEIYGGASSSLTTRPVVSQPERSTSEAALTSSSPMVGR